MAKRVSKEEQRRQAEDSDRLLWAWLDAIADGSKEDEVATREAYQKHLWG